MTFSEHRKTMKSKKHVQSVQHVKAALDILSRELTQPICYSEAAFRIKLPACEANRYCSSIITRALNLMCKEDMSRNFPFRAALFVSKKRGIPSKGFWNSQDVGLDWVADRDKFEAHEALLAEFLMWRKSQPKVNCKHGAQKQDVMNVKFHDLE